jgi:probable rRNA maturation factor
MSAPKNGEASASPKAMKSVVRARSSAAPKPSPKIKAGVQPRNVFSIQSRQSTRRINLRFVRKIISVCLAELLSVEAFELGVQFVNDREMTRVNEGYLQHAGSTDVITFDYLETRSPSSTIFGDIYICIDEAIRQAKRFRTSWQQELVRYAAHGILHLSGYDDRTARLRSEMKREENRLMKALARRFDRFEPWMSARQVWFCGLIL